MSEFKEVEPLILWEEGGEVQVEAEIVGDLIELTNTGVMLDHAQALALYDWLGRALNRGNGERVLVDAGFLRLAKCPDCDGGGTIAVEVAEGYVEIHPCQWCDERQSALAAAESAKEKGNG